MKDLFLYRLYKHSLKGFLFVCLFILLYLVFFYKKMDSVFFPYNSMYAVDFKNGLRATTYAFKVNGRLVKITDNLYWKKDFLEASLISYSNYKKKNDKVFMDDYLAAVTRDEPKRIFFLNRLTAGKEASANWPAWFFKFVEIEVPEAAEIELIQYELRFKKNEVNIEDSTIIFKTISI